MKLYNSNYAQKRNKIRTSTLLVQHRLLPLVKQIHRAGITFRVRRLEPCTCANTLCRRFHQPLPQEFALSYYLTTSRTQLGRPICFRLDA